MKLLFTLLAVLLAGCFTPTAVGYASPSGSITVETFGPHLDPYGAWMDFPGYGRVWQPSSQYVGADFYPYGSGGRWVSTNAGWVFDSDYPFGWAVFHYGRWFRDDNYGWLWTPGRRWAPSWVSWRAGGQYVGWAPMGPSGRVGFDDWCFVETNRFTAHNVYAYGIRDRDYFHRAVEVTGPVRGGSYGPPPSWVSRTTRQDIKPVPVDRVQSAGRFVPPPPPPGSGEPRRRTRAALPAGRYSEQRQGGYRGAPPPPPPPSSYNESGLAQPRAYERQAPPPPPAPARRSVPSPAGNGGPRMMPPPPPPPRR